MLEARSPESKCQPGPAPCGGSRGESFLASSSSWWPPAIPGTAWLAAGLLQSLLPSSHGFFPIRFCVLSPSHRTAVIGFMLTLVNMTSSQLITSAKLLFPNRVVISLAMWGGEWNDTIQPNTGMKLNPTSQGSRTRDREVVGMFLPSLSPVSLSLCVILSVILSCFA